ncbi:MAG: hypothetical protein WD802_08955 [Gemmatimonadaceae bacterium]
MAVLKLRIDEPQQLLKELGTQQGTELDISIPARVSSQDVRDVAYSIRDGIFVRGRARPSFRFRVGGIEHNPDGPNFDLILLKGKLQNVARVRAFVDEWSGNLDLDGNGEPIELTSEQAEKLLEGLEGEERASVFRFPELVNWFREVRSHFDQWDPDEA